DDFVSELSKHIANIHADVEAQLLGHVDTASRAVKQIESALDQAAGLLPMSARAQVASLCEALSTQVAKIKSRFASIHSGIDDVRARIERFGKDPTNAVERSQVASGLSELLKSKTSDRDVKRARLTAKNILSLTERMSEAKTTLEIRYE